MKDKNNSTEKINKYLSGELEGKELDTFLEQLQKDKKLQQMVQFEEDVIRGFEEVAEDDLKLQMDDFHEEMEQEFSEMSPQEWDEINLAAELEANMKEMLNKLNQLSKDVDNI